MDKPLTAIVNDEDQVIGVESKEVSWLSIQQLLHMLASRPEMLSDGLEEVLTSYYI